MVCSTFIYFSYELQLCCCVVYCPAHKFCCLYARTLCVPANTKWHFYVNQCARSPAHVCVAHKKKYKRQASKKNNLFDWKTIYLTRILLEYLMVFLFFFFFFIHFCTLSTRVLWALYVHWIEYFIFILALRVELSDGIRSATLSRRRTRIYVHL